MLMTSHDSDKQRSYVTAFSVAECATQTLCTDMLMWHDKV